MSSHPGGRFEVLEGFPPDVVAIAAHGEIAAADYEVVLIPLVERTIKAEGKAKLLYILGPDFRGYTAGAALDDARFGLMHLGDFARIAVVTDVEWIRLGVKMFAPLLRSPVRVFPIAGTVEAKAWIAEDDRPTKEGPGVAADYTLPTLEDRG